MVINVVSKVGEEESGYFFYKKEFNLLYIYCKILVRQKLQTVTFVTKSKSGEVNYV